MLLLSFSVVIVVVVVIVVLAAVVVVVVVAVAVVVFAITKSCRRNRKNMGKKTIFSLIRRLIKRRTFLPGKQIKLKKKI